MSVEFKDNSAEVRRKVESAVERALEAMGLQCQSHAIRNIQAAGRVKTGRMAGSITHQVDKGNECVYVGTNLNYAIYNEVGTGIYASKGNGRKTPWVYVDSEGVGHRTRGLPPIHMIKNAAADHADEYRRIAEQYLKV